VISIIDLPKVECYMTKTLHGGYYVPDCSIKNDWYVISEHLFRNY